MAKCFIKGCKTGATKRLVIKDAEGNTKNRPICELHANEQITDPASPLKESIMDADKKHH